MTKAKSTKRALLASGLALFMCISMFVGSTFAWFTDSAKTGVNTIQAGTLDIVLEYEDANGVWQDAEGKTLNFKTADNRTDILWEPGCTYELPAIRVRNNGNLALKYEILVNGINGDAKLLEAIEFTANDATIAVFADNLTAKDEASAPIVIKGHMKETAGNEYQGLSIEGLGITVVATQYTYEKDSYSKLYDELATYMNKNADGEWEIATVGQLVYFAKTVNEGKDYAGETVVLIDDIDLSGINWAPIGNWDYTFCGTFDGQGHTISNLTINAPTVEGAGLFGVVQNATIKGIKVNNADINAYSMVAAIVGSPYSGCTVSDCHVSGDINIVAEYAYVAGIAAYGYFDIDNCSVIADGTGVIKANVRNAAGGVVAWLLENGNSIKNCTAKNLEITAWGNVGSISGFVHFNNVVEGCTAENIKLTKTRVGGNPSIGALFGGWEYGAGKTITVTNNIVKDVTMAGNAIPYAFDKSDVYGSAYGGSATDIFVESGNSYSYVNNMVTYATSNSVLANAISAGEKNIELSAGNFTVPANSDVEFVGAGKDTVIALDGAIGSANISNATVTGPTCIDVDAGKTATFKDVVFDSKLGGASGGQYGSVYGDIVFDGCTFEKMLHFDSTHGSNILIKDCTFGVLGTLKVGAGANGVEVKDCTFVNTTSTSIWGEKGIVIYCPVTFTECEFNNRAVVVSPAGQTVTFNSCTMNGGSPVYYVDNTDGIIRGGNVPNVIINN